MPSKLVRTVPSITFTALRTNRERLPREFVNFGLWLRLAGDYDTGATGPTLRDETPYNLVRAFRLLQNSVVKQDWTGEALYAYNFFLIGRNPLADEPAATASLTDEPFVVNWFLPVKLQNSGRPQATYLDTSKLDNFDLEVVWGDGNTLASANIPTGIAATLEIRAAEFLAGSEVFGGMIDHEVVVVPITRTFAAATTTGIIELNNDFLHRALLIRVSDEAAGVTLSDTLLNGIVLRQRGTIRLIDVTYAHQQAIQLYEQRLAENYAGGAPTVTGSRIEGYLYIDLLELGIQDRVDPGNRFELVVDVDAATRLEVFQIMLAPIV